MKKHKVSLLAGFFYDLLRDMHPAGVMEKVMKDWENETPEEYKGLPSLPVTVCTNGNIAKYAQELARRFSARFFEIASREKKAFF